MPREPTLTVHTVHTPRSANKRMAPQEQLTLQNWLSTRVEQVGVAGHLVVAPDHAHERALVASRLATARHLGLVVVPGTYLPRPKGGVGEARDEGDEQQVEHVTPPAHLVRC